MPKILLKGSYSAAGAQGIVASGGTSRREAVTGMVEQLGGTVEAFYFAQGETDVYVIVDVPDASTGLAMSLAVNASGAVRLSTVPLFTPEEVDAAGGVAVAYRPPGA